MPSKAHLALPAQEAEGLDIRPYADGELAARLDLIERVFGRRGPLRDEESEDQQASINDLRRFNNLSGPLSHIVSAWQWASNLSPETERSR